MPAFTRLTRRQQLIWKIAVAAIVLFALSSYFPSSLTFISTTAPAKQIPEYPPPTYDAIRSYERNLPQHNLDLPFPGGQTGRYVKFSNQIKALGWNNCLNEVYATSAHGQKPLPLTHLSSLMNAHLAYESKRAYVFQDYYWKPQYFPWKVPDWPWPRTPLNALISGPTAGGPWDPDDPAPRSVSEDWFEIVCPEIERRIIHVEDFKPAVANAPGDVVFDHWKRILHDAPERCIEIVPAPAEVDAFSQTFDLWLWGSTRMLAMWERFLNSPTSRLLGPSPVVRAAVERNERLFAPRHAFSARRDSFARLMAVHIRRGDYNDACLNLANYNATYYSWNLLDVLPDRFDPPPGGTMGQNTPENIEVYKAHCLPSMDSIVRTIQKARADYIRPSSSFWHRRVLDAIHLLTNEDNEWVVSLKDKLHREGWQTVVTSHDLVLDQEQIAVSMAVDMDIARRAAVFIGNGVSPCCQSLGVSH